MTSFFVELSDRIRLALQVLFRDSPIIIYIGSLKMKHEFQVSKSLRLENRIVKTLQKLVILYIGN